MKDLMVMKVGGGSLSRLSGDGDLVVFAADLSFFLCVYTFSCCVFLYLEFHFLPLL